MKAVAFLLFFALGVYAQVKTGLQVLADSGWSALKGKRVGVVSNPTGIFPNLTHMVDVMVAQPSFDIVAVFGPEHGFRGDQQAGSADEFYVDPQTGLPVYSIYGESGSSLDAIIINSTATTLVFDIQEVGARFYTYIWTMWNVMESCARLGFEYYVLDRPQPLGGLKASGPVLLPGYESGIGELPIALNYAMTIGELALMFSQHFIPTYVPGTVSLTQVIKMQGWKRGMYYQDTGLPWVMPSPNMPTTDTAMAYVGFGFLEGTNCSEGRGTTRPFELVGAPFITLLNNNKTSFADYLNALDNPVVGGRFREAYFQPTFDKYEGLSIPGTQIYVTDRTTFDAVQAVLTWLTEAHLLWPKDFAWEVPTSGPYWIDLMAGTDKVRTGIDSNMTVAQLQAQWQDDLDDFITLRQNYLLY